MIGYRSNWVLSLQILFGALLLGLFNGSIAFTQTSFYQNKTVTIVQAGAAGGVADMRTKAVVPFLQKYIPGSPAIVMQYVDGGGGRKAANHLYNSVRPDGLTVGCMSTPFVMHPMDSIPRAVSDFAKVSSSGRLPNFGFFSPCLHSTIA